MPQQAGTSDCLCFAVILAFTLDCEQDVWGPRPGQPGTNPEALSLADKDRCRHNQSRDSQYWAPKPELKAKDRREDITARQLPACLLAVGGCLLNAVHVEAILVQHQAFLSHTSHIC